ncbi:MAG TPA: isoleucine--tRNA ligase, partial [Bacteroidetes bacterium]|nr:isoleucine--tRNA ligase [Bacteroidota bacterium]
DYVFYDGPPGTNAPPHIGHMMQSALKDLWPRFETMRGKRVLRKAGWDTHGLPIELTADRDLGLESKREIEEYGVEKYISYCRETVFRFKEAWEEAIWRIGRFLDLEHFYATYTTEYIQSDWWVLKQAWETRVRPEFADPGNLLGGDRFLYKDYRISAWDPKQGTTLSNFEVAQGYLEVTDLALYVKFPILGEENTHLLAWTTTAWTLLSNIAVAVGPDLPYVKLRLTEEVKGARAGERLIVARSRLHDVERFIGAYEIEGEFPGRELQGLKYDPLWDFQKLRAGQRGHEVFAEEFVAADEGTGVVHIAPYGEDDFRLIKAHRLTAPLLVNEHGKVDDRLDGFGGRWFKDSDLEVDIVKDLAARGRLIGREKHEHTYPHHYKTGTPLMFFPRPGWFIRATAMREEMLEANRLINWVPPRIREGRFGKWLENVIDWNITRERYWGSPLPVWSREGNGEAVCVGSLAELNEYIIRSGGKPIPPDGDLHKPWIDEVVLRGEDGAELRRENFVLDSWFNAGIMPWGQVGYPAAEGSV